MNVHCCDSISHHASPWRRGEHAKKVKNYTGSRGYRRSQGRQTTPNYSLKARMLRIKQTNGLDFSTVKPTSPRRLSILSRGRFFMKFRGPKALSNRRRKTIVCPTLNGEAAAGGLRPVILLFSLCLYLSKIRSSSSSALPAGSAAALGQMCHVGGPFFLQITTSNRDEIPQTASRPPCANRRRRFRRRGASGGSFRGIQSRACPFQLLAIKLGVGPVLRAHAPHVTGGAGAQARRNEPPRQ